MSDKVMLILQIQIDELRSELQKRIDMNEGLLELIADLKAQIPQWLPIEKWDGIGIVRLSSCLDNRYKVRDVIGYKHGNEYFGLNHNDCEEGSELLEWNPTHYMLLLTPPEKEL